MAILYGVAACCLFGVVFLHNAKQGMLLCVVSTAEISPSSKIRTPIHHGSTKFLRPGESFISSSHHGYCDVFFFLWEHFLKVFGSKSDVLLPVGTSTITLV